MSRAIGLLLVALSLGWTDAAAAQGAGPDVPPGEARVLGRLEHATRPPATAGLEVVLYALSEDGSAGLRRTTSDSQGAFRFEGISNDPGVVYLIGARVDEIPFGQRFQFSEDERERSVIVQLSDPTRDTSAVRAGGVTIRLERGCTHLRVEHMHQVENPGAQVIFVPEAERAGAEPILEVELPVGAEGFESLLGTAGLDLEAGRVRFWGPLYPGEQELQFGYGQALEREQLELGLPNGAGALRVLAPHDELQIAAPGLRAAAPGGPHQLWLAEDLEPGQRLALRVVAPARPTSELQTSRAELWLELDDAALEVNERLEVILPEAAAASETPLLCLSLPAGSRGMRFSEAIQSAGLRRDPSGDLALHGPFPAGTSQLAFSYRLASSEGGAQLTRRFDRPLPLLSVLIADTGIVTETDRLHRRRPMRTEDRLYLHWEGFAIEPGESVELGLRLSPPRAGASGWAVTGFALLAGLASLGFLLAPLGASTPQRSDDGDAGDLERTALAWALSDLEEDLETGKLDAENHAALLAELEGRAKALRDRPVAKPAPPAEPQCPSCQASARPDDRFCAQCGAALAGAATGA